MKSDILNQILNEIPWVIEIFFRLVVIGFLAYSGFIVLSLLYVLAYFYFYKKIKVKGLKVYHIKR